MVLGQGQRLVASPSDIQNSAKYCLGLKLDSSTFFFFFLNLIFFNFFCIFENEQYQRRLNEEN